MRARIRDFIHTTDDLFFAVTSYLHPDGRILSFLRYIPDRHGERSLDSARYSKVSSDVAYRFLEDAHPEYLHHYDELGVLMMGVPHDRVEEILRPENRLEEIMESPSDPLLEKVVKIANALHDAAGIPYRSMGVSGSILPGLYDPENSDIDFVVYGLKNHRRAMEAFGELKDDPSWPLMGLDEELLRRVYSKRIVDDTLSFREFCWYEMRKNNRGRVDGTLFDILAARDWSEIDGHWGDTTYEPHGTITIECTVTDALEAFDNPSRYLVEDVNVIEGPAVEIGEVVSFTHTYAGQAREGERIVARGKLERFTGKSEGYRVVVGTTREAMNEFIKLKDLRLE